MLEQRHAFLERMMEEAHIRSSQSTGESGLLPPTSWPQLSSQGMRYAVVNLNPHMLDSHSVLSGMQLGGAYLGRGPLGSHHSRGGDQNSKQMLDQEALTCLLVLLFLDQTKLHNNRLHRIIKNLSQHVPTRAWILSSLLAIIKEMRNTPSPVPPAISATCPMPPPLTISVAGRNSGSSMSGSSSSNVGSIVSSTPMIVTPQHYTSPHWLDISINAALGSHAKIFQFEGEHSTGKGSSGYSNRVNIHPQAGTAICHNVFDLLIFLGRHFGSSFLPADLLPKDKIDEKKDEANEIVSNFWQILMRLDGASGRKGKGSMKSFKFSPNKGILTDQELFSNSIIGQLMGLFTHDIIRDNISLIDKLLRLLSIVSGSIPRTEMKSVPKESLLSSSGISTPSQLDQNVPKPVSSPTEKYLASSSKDSESEIKDSSANIKMSIVAPPLLSSVILVLTSGLCSEEGLEEATTMLTNLSKCSIPTREQILFMLLDGVRTIGKTLCTQIINLDESVNIKLQEQPLEKELLSIEEDTMPKLKPVPSGSGESSAHTLGGIVLPTVTPEEQHVDHSHDLHIPTMEPLTCKGSQQSFFVRMLKVVCQLRESAQLAISLVNKGATPTSTGATPLSAQNVEMQSTPSAEPASSSGPSDQNQEGSSSHSKAGAMPDVPEDKPVFHEALSQQLKLDELWDILSNCLDALSRTEDPHAVFVLQPTVEAFFLVHANSKTEDQAGGKKKTSMGGLLRSRSNRLSSSHAIADAESNPASPSPFSPLPSTPGPGEIDADPFSHLPPDTAKFLKFASKGS